MSTRQNSPAHCRVPEQTAVVCPAQWGISLAFVCVSYVCVYMYGGGQCIMQMTGLPLCSLTIFNSVGYSLMALPT